MQTFTFHHDAGHGWLAVSVADLIAVGLTKRDFSRYSYRRRDVCYLEEDCDAPRFLAAFERERGFTPATPERYDGQSSPIRGYARLNMPA